MSNKILVLGATGKVGQTLVQLLAEKGEQVKAATRQPAAYPAQPNVEAVAFDQDQPQSWSPALADVDRLFLLSAKAGDLQPDQTLNPLIDAAKTAGVRKIVLMTAMGVEQAEGVGLREVEKHLIASGVNYTILRPNWFMQNVTLGFMRRETAKPA